MPQPDSHPADHQPWTGQTTDQQIVDRHVLIVDDDASTRTFVERVVRASGYHTVVASSGEDACAQAATLTRVDLLITDLRMPGLQGDELASRLLIRQPALRILYLTGFAHQLVERRVGCGADETFLNKPCTPRCLLEAIASLIGAASPHGSRENEGTVP